MNVEYKERPKDTNAGKMWDLFQSTYGKPPTKMLLVLPCKKPSYWMALIDGQVYYIRGK
jgi:hypothetical protein